MQNVINISNKGSIVSLEMRSRIFFLRDNCSFRCLASFPWGSHPVDPRGLPTGDGSGEIPGNFTFLTPLHSSAFIELLSLSDGSCSLMTANVLVQDGFTSNNLEFEFPPVSKLESFAKDVLGGWERLGVEIIGVNRTCMSLPFDVFSVGTFSFLSVTTECSAVTLFISITWEPPGE